ncbi:mevalonate kinase [Actinobaculum suis]|uniref:Mevalonate kinase n=1 Tax=Actinobaculum suis TaxID=1657 RepID=A0A7Z8YA70_9ACTO|nr:mevalonate kinase [Actinobaculum suis]VDG76898.1 mevalonate kinase [Actinobaculum suis]
MNQSPQLGAFDTQTRLPRLGNGVGRAHGKVILFGEHAVVYGAPAISFPVGVLPVIANASLVVGESTLESELYRGPVAQAPARLAPVLAAIDAALDAAAPGLGAKVAIYSDIPYERGLGSSAAISSAVIEAICRAAGHHLSREERFDLTQTAERVAHGHPSGMDAHAVTANSVIKFEKPVVTPVAVGAPFYFVIADSGLKGSTRQAVNEVRMLRETSPHYAIPRITELGNIAERAESYFRNGRAVTMGLAMWRAHSLLKDIGVSSQSLDTLVAAAHQAGALGAKLTGGGIGGCVVALAGSRAEADRVRTGLLNTGAKNAWVTTLEPTK